MSEDNLYVRRLHAFAVVLAVCTFVLVCAGGNVTSKGAGLAVPDWPLSYGSLNPPGWWSAGNVRAEHGHRLIAGTIGMLTLGFLIAAWIGERRGKVPRSVAVLASVASFSVVLQAVLGGLTVLHYLPPEISVSHAFLGQSFFCMAVALAVVTGPRWRSDLPARPDSDTVPLRLLGSAFVAAVVVQLLLGASMRHAKIGLSIPDFPLSYGRVFPPLDETSIHNINVDRVFDGLHEITAVQILLHWLHRAWALVVAAGGLWIAARALGRHSDRSELVFPALALVLLLAMQLVLGAATVLTNKHHHVATTHLAVGALILATSVVLSMWAFRLRPAPGRVVAADRTRAASAHPQATVS